VAFASSRAPERWSACTCVEITASIDIPWRAAISWY
jgi:hypothetical protein